MKTIRDIWVEFKDQFQKVSLSPESDFKWLVENVLEENHSFHWTLHSELILSPLKAEVLSTFCRRRAEGEPIAYILGEWDFYGRRFIVEPGVLIPRPETELIIEIAKKKFKDNHPQWILDFGSGSGCLALTLAYEFSTEKMIAIEKSPQAIPILEKNKKLHGLTDRLDVFASDVVDFHCTDLWGKIDLIVANPPYIDFLDQEIAQDVKKYEPKEALFSEERGFAAIHSWAVVAGKYLRPGGFYLFEFGKGQAQEVFDFVTSMGVFDKVEIEKDLNGIDRVAICKKSD
ncbi:MAG: peptide chain release factor N(5)-glutamine methyltransferase [Bdellovibrionales bacterium]|nr:peptide chain release factor N(5)-glutamine methyltransferase [Bdellovibrionales bacterium]